MIFYGYRMSLHSYRVSPHDSGISLTAPGWSFTVQGEPPLLQVNLNESLVTIISYSQLRQVDLLWFKDEPLWFRMRFHGSRVSLHALGWASTAPRQASMVPKWSFMSPGWITMIKGVPDLPKNPSYPHHLLPQPLPLVLGSPLALTVILFSPP